MKLRAAHITDLCRDAINDVARGIGGDGFRDDSPLQRHWRDLNTVAAHAYLDIDTATETAGRLALDLPIEDRLV
jgi:3-hydroxy-9,10-secoandrosta-1,3,5(10)-triene-9,17-dione monooxygenase